MRNIKFLGGTETFTQEQLNNAVSVASQAVTRVVGDQSTPEPSEAEKDALRDLLGALGLTTADDPRAGRGGKPSLPLQHPTAY